MRTRPDGSTAPVPAHAFTADYLELLAQRDEPVTGAEADAAGPWHLEPYLEGWAVLRQGESVERNCTPTAAFRQLDTARLLAAVLPSTGRRPRYRLGQERDTLGYPVLDDDQVVGHFPHFDEALLAALNLADALVSVPGDLAWLLDAAGGPTLEYAGRIALHRALEFP
jgi:hypothetical protein